MNIHELNTKAITNPAYVALDDGSDTYKLDLNAKLSTMQSSISGAESNIATAQGDITLLQTNMSQAQGAISSAQGEITDLQSDMNALSTQTSASIGNLQTELDATEDDVTDLKEAFNQLIDDTIEVTTGKNILPPTLYNGYINSSGVLVQYSDWKTTEYVNVSNLEKVVFSAARANNNRETITMHFLTTYNNSKERIEQISSPSSTYIIGENVTYIRFSIHSEEFHDYMLESGTTASALYVPYEATYTAINDSYALKTEVAEAIEVANDIAVKDYQTYTPTFSEDPSAIWHDGALITTLSGTKTTDYIDCSGWVGIRYTGANWLGCRSLAFYDENKTWISSLPAEGDDNTEYYTNEIVNVPINAKYVIFGDLTAKVSQTLRIEVAEQYTIIGKWHGKKWTVVGDSLTEANLRTTMNYHDYIHQSTDITVVNMGVSGCGYKRSDNDGKAFYQRISNVPVDSDVITIFGSFNDLGSGASLGSATDTGTTTIGGCINTTLDNLFTAIPLANVGIVSPTPWQNSNPTNEPNTASQYCDLLEAVCKRRGIPYLDLFHCSQLRPWDSTFRTLAYSKDEGNGTHPDEQGHKLIAPRFEGFLDLLLLD